MLTFFTVLLAEVLFLFYLGRHPISSTVFGSNALVVKPSQSLCPMLVVGILNRYGYEQLKVCGVELKLTFFGFYLKTSVKVILF